MAKKLLVQAAKSNGAAMFTDCLSELLYFHCAIAIRFFDEQIHNLKSILCVTMSDEGFGVASVIAEPTYCIKE